MKVKLSIATILFFVFINSATAQMTQAAEFPEEDKACPDFTIHNIKYFRLQQASLKDFSGKWLFLDFWSKNCGSCVESFPKTNELVKEFGDKVQFMLVGYQDREAQIEPMYARFREREHLLMPSGFDSTLAKIWNVGNPYIIIIDDKGIVRGITTKINREQLEALLQGGHPLARMHRGDYRSPYDPRKPFLINGNGGADSDFLFRSILTKWNPTIHVSIPIAIDTSYGKGTFQVMGISLERLYRLAYFGRWYWGSSDTGYYGHYSKNVVIETKDSAIFQYQFNPIAKNVFCYSLIIPKSQGTKERLQEVMQRDLKNYFGFDVGFETRQCPCWKLVATDEAKIRLKTAGGPLNRSIEIIPRAKYRLENVPVTWLIHAISGKLGDANAAGDGVILDETGIVGNIDITINDSIDRDGIRKSLKENGLTLVPATKEMKVLVIKDAATP